MDDRIQGKGRSTYANGNVYEGDWQDGACSEAAASAPRSSQRAVYIFFYRSSSLLSPPPVGRINGFGTLTYADGDKCVAARTRK